MTERVNKDELVRRLAAPPPEKKNYFFLCILIGFDLRYFVTSQLDFVH